MLPTPLPSQIWMREPWQGWLLLQKAMPCCLPARLTLPSSPTVAIFLHNKRSCSFLRPKVFPEHGGPWSSHWCIETLAKAKRRLWGCFASNATSSSLLQPGWRSSIWLFSHHVFLISLRGAVNQVTHKWWGFRRSRRYHSNRRSCSSTRCWHAPCVLEQEDSMSSVRSGCWLQAARLSREWKGYRLFCQLSSVFMFKYLKVTKLQRAENEHKGLSLRLPRFAEGNQQKRIKRTEQNNHRCYDVTLLVKPIQWAYRESSISRLSADSSVLGHKGRSLSLVIQ